MDVLKFSGWESGDAVEAFAAGGTWSVQGVVKRTGDYALRTNPTGAGTGYHGYKKMGADGKPTPFNVDPIYYTIYYSYATKPASNYEIIAYAVDINDAAMFYLCLGSGGNLVALNGAGALLDVGGITLNSGTLYKIDIKLWYAAGIYEVKINNVVDMDGSSVYLGINIPGAIYLGKRFNLFSNTVDFFYDDFCPASGDYIGACEVIRMGADGNGTYTDWTGDWQDIDEIPHDTDTTHIDDGGFFTVETANLEDAAGAGLVGTPLAVAPCAVARKTSFNDSAVQLRLRSGATDSDTANATLGIVYTFLSRVYTVDPDDSGAWTEARLNALEVGVKQVGFGVESRCTSMYVMVLETGEVPAGEIKEISGVAWDDAAEVSGVAKADISEVSGVTAN